MAEKKCRIESNRIFLFVMAGLDPAIHGLHARCVEKDVDARVKPGHDER